MDEFDTALAAPDGPVLLAQVTRLYATVLGRPPDPGGLRDHLLLLRAGASLPDLAGGMLASPEFAAQPGAAQPRRLLRRNALGPEARGTHAQGMDAEGTDAEGTPDTLPALAAALVQSPEAAARHPVLPALFPDGLLLEDSAAYRTWLAARAADQPALAPPPAPVSFLLALAEPDPPGLPDTLDSVLALGWPGLELVIAAWRFGPGLRHRAKADRRIRLVRTPFWHHARALSRARGTFAAILHPGDRLNPADTVLAALPGADIVLSDEDALDPEGLRHTPLLGAAWDPDRVRAAGRPGLPLIRTALLRQTGLRRGDTQATLLLRAAAHTTTPRITHVPALLLSRRTPAPHPAQTPPRALLPNPAPRASIIIATRDRAELLGACLAGLLHRTDYDDLEIVVVDNGSTVPDALALLDHARTDPRIRVLSRPGPFNWAALNNDGARAATGSVLVLLNNDTDVIEPGWLRELVAQATRPDVGAVGAKLLYPDGTIQHAGVVLGRDGHAIHMWRTMPGDAPGYTDDLAIVREVAATTGACLAIRRDVFEAVGGCDAENLPITWNDIDLCLRVRERGLRVLWTPFARLLHLEQASRGSDATPENDARFRREQAYMRRRWGDAMCIDPFLNEQLLPSETRLRLAVRYA